MSNLATPEFLSHVKKLFPSRSPFVLKNSWYLVAAVAFSASNVPEAIPGVFHFALEELKQEGIQPKEEDHKARLTLARRMRDCILQAGMINGYARAINSLVALHQAMPDDLKDTETLRNTTQSMNEYANNGRKVFRAMYADNADNVQKLLDDIYPDMGWFSNTIAYGMIYGGGDVLSQVEVSFVIATANIAMDTPKQIAWHLTNAMNGDATLQEVQAVRNTAILVVEKCGVKWKNAVPEVVL